MSQTVSSSKQAAPARLAGFSGPSISESQDRAYGGCGFANSSRTSSQRVNIMGFNLKYGITFENRARRNHGMSDMDSKLRTEGINSQDHVSRMVTGPPSSISSHFISSHLLRDHIDEHKGSVARGVKQWRHLLFLHKVLPHPLFFIPLEVLLRVESNKHGLVVRTRISTRVRKADNLWGKQVPWDRPEQS